MASGVTYRHPNTAGHVVQSQHAGVVVRTRRPHVRGPDPGQFRPWREGHKDRFAAYLTTWRNNFMLH